MQSTTRLSVLKYLNIRIENILSHTNILENIKTLRGQQDDWHSAIYYSENLKKEPILQVSNTDQAKLMPIEQGCSNYLHCLLDKLPDIKYDKLTSGDYSFKMYILRRRISDIINELGFQCLSLNVSSKDNVNILLDDLRHSRTCQLQFFIEKNKNKIQCVLGKDYYLLNIVPLFSLDINSSLIKEHLCNMRRVESIVSDSQYTPPEVCNEDVDQDIESEDDWMDERTVGEENKGMGLSVANLSRHNSSLESSLTEVGCCREGVAPSTEHRFDSVFISEQVNIPGDVLSAFREVKQRTPSPLEREKHPMALKEKPLDRRIKKKHSSKCCVIS